MNLDQRKLKTPLGNPLKVSMKLKQSSLVDVILLDHFGDRKLWYAFLIWKDMERGNHLLSPWWLRSQHSKVFHHRLRIDVLCFYYECDITDEIYKVQNEFMAHAVANEWRSQKEVILLSQVMTSHLCWKLWEYLTITCAADAHEWAGEHMSRQSATTR